MSGLDAAAVGTQLVGSVLLRPYVFAFLGAFAVLAARDLGPRRALGFFAWGWAVAFAAEYASTRVGVPFGLYHYTGETVGVELYLSNVPFFDSISFPFLAYAAYCLARWTLGRGSGPGPVALAAGLMTLLDVVIDPLAVRGGQWFLGRIFYYPDGGAYFGVPISNFLGWLAVGGVIVGGYVWAAGRREPPAAAARPGAALYYAVLGFNLALTAWIGEYGLLAAGGLLHAAALLVLWGARASAPRAAPARAPLCAAAETSEP